MNLCVRVFVGVRVWVGAWVCAWVRVWVCVQARPASHIGFWSWGWWGICECPSGNCDIVGISCGKLKNSCFRRQTKNSFHNYDGVFAWTPPSDLNQLTFDYCARIKPLLSTLIYGKSGVFLVAQLKIAAKHFIKDPLYCLPSKEQDAMIKCIHIDFLNHKTLLNHTKNSTIRRPLMTSCKAWATSQICIVYILVVFVNWLS